jgi:hypothetical protein
LVEEAFPDASRLLVVQEQLATHAPSSLYAPFRPEEAHRIRQRLAFPSTPGPGSWRTRAESALGIFARGGLSRPLEGQVDRCTRTAAWEAERNTARRPIHWHFTTSAAREKLSRLSPDVKSQLD